MLKLISSNQSADTDIDHFVSDHAPALALIALGVIQGKIDYQALENICTEQLQDWWQLNVLSNEPNSDYESAYWNLMYTLEKSEDYQLLGHKFTQHQVKHYAHYLLGLEDYVTKLPAIRP
ncbi:TPA: hypothetical protein ACX6QF_001102 [Photobacterium damselae]